jgi:hypothetical protein
MGTFPSEELREGRLHKTGRGWCGKMCTVAPEGGPNVEEGCPEAAQGASELKKKVSVCSHVEGAHLGSQESGEGLGPLANEEVVAQGV